MCLSSGIWGRCLICKSGITRAFLLQLLCPLPGLDPLRVSVAAVTCIPTSKQTFLSQQYTISSVGFVGLGGEDLFLWAL